MRESARRRLIGLTTPIQRFLLALLDLPNGQNWQVSIAYNEVLPDGDRVPASFQTYPNSPAVGIVGSRRTLDRRS